MSGDVCLAVARVKECWDTDNNLAFISDGVLDYFDGDEFNLTASQIVKHPKKHYNYNIDIYDFVNSRLPRYRKELGEILNNIHGVDFSEKYWGLLFDIWLIHFLAVIYDRTIKLKNAKDQIDNVYLNAIHVKQYCFQCGHDFVNNSRDDVFNQYLYTEVASVLGIKIHGYIREGQFKKFDDNAEKEHLLSLSFKKTALVFSKKAVGLLARTWVRVFNPVLILDGYFSNKDSLSIMLRSFGRVVILPSLIFFKKLPPVRCDEKMREKLKVSVVDEYDEVTNRILSSCFPANLLEKYSEINSSISSFKSVKAIGSAICLAHNETYKILAGKIVEEGGGVFGFQHGGGYGIQKYRLNEYFERNSVDAFYGWDSKGRNGDSLPTINLRYLNNYRNKRALLNVGKLRKLLFVSTNTSRYVYSQQPDNAEVFLSLLSGQFQFYSNLTQKIKENFILRAYPNDHGWNYKEMWSEYSDGGIKFDSSKSCGESLVNCRVYVTDHISTTWLQALYIGVPVVLYLDLERYTMRDEVRELFEKLKGAGLLYDTPEDAAHFVSNNYENIEMWWNFSGTQLVINEFKNHFFSSSDTFVQDWTNELLTWHR